ncbi:MAG: thioredoxin family protein [Prolixibacteraceae bacterium]|jgi:peroxiredoxin
MKRMFFIVFLISFAVSVAVAGGYGTGDKAADFKLKNVDGKFISFSNYPDAKGFVVIFTCNHCPYAQAYQDRIIEIDKKYKVLGYPVIAISPSDPELVPADSYDKMVAVANSNGYTFPYLIDANQEVYKRYGATKTPTAFLLQRQTDNLFVAYNGAIDNNYQDALKVTEPYLANVLDALLAGKQPDPQTTKAIGCGIQSKK